MTENAVIIPFYKQSLTRYDIIALEQCFKVLGKHTIIAIAPNTLDFSFLPGKFAFQEIIRFDNNYFNSIYGYNSLMVSADFYKAFVKFNCILIYQLDAFVFTDSLDYWANQKYDYIGAPWLEEDVLDEKSIGSEIKKYIHVFFDFQHEHSSTKLQFINTVGNGGFSLRRVERFYKLSLRFKNRAKKYIDHNHSAFNEDRFWSVEVNRKINNLVIPNYKTAISFSVETFPEKALAINNNNLPFGCHAWDKNSDFWRPVFKDFAYNI